MPDPSPLEQSLLELINRARIDPQGEFDRLIPDPSTRSASDTDSTSAIRSRGVNMAVLESQFDALAPAAPLALNEDLSDAALAQTEYQVDNEVQSHFDASGARSSDRALAAGYDWRSGGGISENVYAFGRSDIHIHTAFFVDWSRTTDTGIQDPPGHRNSIMRADHVEIGISVAPGGDGRSFGPLVVTEVFGHRADYTAQLVGVAIADADGDSFYDIGEGVGGVTVTAEGAPGTFTTTTWDAGGYQMMLPEGTYTVTFSGGDPDFDIERSVTMGPDNAKLDAVVDATPEPPALDLSTTEAIVPENTTGTVLVATSPATLTLEGPDASDFVFENGILGFAVPPDFEAPGDSDRDNVYEVTIVAISDEGGIETAIEATIRVTDIDNGLEGRGEVIVGTDRADVLDGTDGADTITGKAGADSISAGAGDDLAAGAAGNDTVRGGAGDDDIGGGFGNDSLIGGAGDDTIGAGRGNDFVNGAGGDDVLNGGQGNDRIFGEAGNDTSGAGFNDDTVSGGFGDDSLGGGTGRDVLFGHDGDDVIGGGEGDDTVNGGDGADFLAGGGRNDALAGADGDDTINPGAGFDTISGGTGADLFVFADFVAGEADVITDFQDGLDRLRMTGIENAPGTGLAGRLAALSPTDSVIGGLAGVRLTYEGQAIDIVGLSVSELSTDDFIFV